MENVKAEQYTGTSTFVQLHAHTLFSYLDGVSSPQQYARACSERKYPAMAITEHGHMGSIPDVLIEFKKVNVRAIAACEIYLNDFEPLRREKFAGKSLKPIKESDPELYTSIMRNRHLTVLAKNQTGFHNLIKLTTQAYATGYYYRPRVWFDKLCEYKEGLIILSGCLNGPVCHELRRTDPDGKRIPRMESDDKRGAVDWIRKFKKEFGEDFFIELQMPGIPGDEWVFRQLVALADYFKIEVVIGCDCCHPDTCVSTDYGLRKISNLQIGDVVLTHNGRYRKIEHINKRSMVDKLVCIQLGSEVHKLTSNHPVAIWDFDNFVVKYVSASNLTKEHRLYYPALSKKPNGIKSVDFSQYLKVRFGTKIVDGFVRTTSPRSQFINIPAILPLTTELCYIIGLYVAEGDIDINQDYQFSFAFHKSERRQIDLIINFFTRFGLNPDYQEVTENGVRVRICSAPFANLFEGMCGNNHINKRLPSFWVDLNNEQLCALLAGCIDGDGTISNNNVTFYSTSQRLIYEVRLALTRFDRYSNICYCKKRIDKRVWIDTSKWNRLYYIRYGLGLIKQLNLDCNIDVRNEGKPRWTKTPHGFAVPIHKLYSEDYDGEVVNLQVADDETYCLTNFNVHNCHYMERKDHELQMIMMAIDQKTTIDDPNMFHTNSSEQYMKTRAELWERFKNNSYSKGIPDSVFEKMCDNTLLIAERCEQPKFDATPKYPTFENADDKLRDLVAKRLIELGLHKITKRYLIDGKEVNYVEQAKIELDRIVDKGYSSYFLITHDLINYGKSKKYIFSPRGSGGGCLVNYLLGVSPILPLPWGLSFDRFLSPSRGGFLLNTRMPEPISRNNQLVNKCC